MKKDVLITIRGEQTADGELDASEMTVTGHYFRLGGNYFLYYREVEETGFGRHRVILKFEDEDRVTMQRQGDYKSRLMIERGRRHQCQYDTGFGDLLIGISGKRIISHLDDCGGEVEFSYVMDINSQISYENKVNIQIKECYN